MTRDVLRSHSHTLGFTFQGDQGGDPMGKHDKPGTADSKDSKDGGKHEKPGTGSAK